MYIPISMINMKIVYKEMKNIAYTFPHIGHIGHIGHIVTIYMTKPMNFHIIMSYSHKC